MPGQESRGQVDGHSADMAAIEPAQPVVHQAHQRERTQEMLAKLPVAGPRLAAIDLERQSVDQERAALVELNVVPAAILERHPVQKCAALNFKGRERRVSQSA